MLRSLKVWSKLQIDARGVCPIHRTLRSSSPNGRTASPGKVYLLSLSPSSPSAVLWASIVERVGPGVVHVDEI